MIENDTAEIYWNYVLNLNQLTNMDHNMKATALVHSTLDVDGGEKCVMISFKNLLVTTPTCNVTVQCS